MKARLLVVGRWLIKGCAGMTPAPIPTDPPTDPGVEHGYYCSTRGDSLGCPHPDHDRRG